MQQPPDSQSLLRSLKTAHESKDFSHLIELISAVFSKIELLTVAFWLQGDGDNLPGVDFDATTQFYTGLISLGSKEVINALMDATDQLASEAAKQSWEDAAGIAVRPLMILLENPLFMEPEHHRVLKKLCTVLVGLPISGEDAFIAAVDKYPKERFEEMVGLIQQFLAISLYDSSQLMEPAAVAAKVLALLYRSNEREHRLSFSAFYNDAVNNEDFNIEEDYFHWEHADRYDFSFCNYPFLYNTESKSRILHLDSRSQMSHQFEDALLRSFFLGGGIPFNVIRVRREHIIADAIIQVQRRPEDLLKPLKVQFVGEDGVDEGGVQKEFFQLIVRKIFDPKYGMFSYDEETRQCWFSAKSWMVDPDLITSYELIGTILSLATYNGHILDLRFPSIVYKKLLGQSGHFNDLMEVDPQLARGLKDLLSFQGDVQDVYMRAFQISVCDMFGETSTVDLKEGGSNINVTAENRQEYVDLCVNYYLNEAIEQPFAAFSRGFHRICGGRVLQMLRPEELRLLICGSATLDFLALERATRYEGGYTKDSPIIKDFWEVIHGLAEEQKRQLLSFATGSDRAPIQGLAALPFVIFRQGPDSERLPTSHTCFNHLLLPEYSSRGKLRERLLLAINNSEGFGLV